MFVFLNGNIIKSLYKACEHYVTDVRFVIEQWMRLSILSHANCDNKIVSFVIKTLTSPLLCFIYF